MQREKGDHDRLSRVRWAGQQPLLLVTLLMGALVALTGCPPPDTTPPGSVTGLTAMAGDARVELNWTNPTDGDFAGVRIVRRTGQAPSSPTDGAVVYEGSGQTFLDTGRDNGTTYYYAVYARDEVPNYSTAAQASGLPTVSTAVEILLSEYQELQFLIASLPDLVLGPVQRTELRELLMQSELLYRAGDDCDAADVIIMDMGVLSKLQMYRQAAKSAKQDATAETTEDLYNRCRMVRYEMLAGLSAKDLCPGQERVGMVAEAKVEDEDNTKLLALAELGEPKVFTAEDGGEVFTQVFVPGAESKLGEPGMPGVPVFRRLIAAPMGSEPYVNILLGKQAAESVFLNLYPFQEEPVDQQTPSDPPSDDVFADPPFVKNEEAYAKDAWYPPDDQLVKLTPLGDVRDLQMFLVEVSAGQYNPARNELRLFAHHDVDVGFDGGGGAFITEASDHAFEAAAPLYMSAVLNRASIPKYVSELQILPVFTGEELLIMTHPDFLTAANTLAAWKRAKGISTRVVQCGTGTGITGRQTNTEIDAWIHAHYFSVFVRPSYILLMGDAEFIAPFDSTTSTIGTDWPYAILGTPGIDHCPDFAVGRIPVDTLSEAATVVANTISYEQTPPGNASSDFYDRAAIASQFQCCLSGSPSGRAQRTFAEVSEFSRNTMMADGKTVDRIYQQTGFGTPRRYFDGALLPSDLGPGSGYPWDGSNADIINAWNDHRFLFIHRDHGWEDGWSHPPLDWGDFGSLTSGAFRPVVFSVNCASGLFDNETAPGVYGTTTTGRYFVERLLLDPNGAVGILGDSRNSPSWANTALLKGFIDAVWPNALGYGPATSQPRLGDILNHGKLYMWTQIGTYDIATSTAERELKLWHAFGDPTLEIWTSNPYELERLPIPELIPEWRPEFNQLHVVYPVEGTVITVQQLDPKLQIPIPIARGVVEGGMAKINAVATPAEGLGYEVSASMMGRLGAFESFEVEM